MMESFVTKDGKKLRRGYTSGSCAAAAAKAAAIMLLCGGELEKVRLLTPSGVRLELDVLDITRKENFVSCGIKKDSGDDPDVTDGMVFYAGVETKGTRGITVEGGEGIGRVTKPGLDRPVGEAAINSVPLRMITEAAAEVCADAGYEGGLRIIISAPGGEEIAKKTFNPRLGIEGGISILGTTGIIEPMSDDAVAETARAELSVRRAEGKTVCLLVPGNFGADFIKESLSVDPACAVTVSNYLGEALYSARELGFSGALAVSHIGKAVKLAVGMFNTHSRWGDCRREIFAAHAAAAGAGRDAVNAIMQSAVTDDMLDILQKASVREAAMQSIMNAIGEQLARRGSESFRAELITFSKTYGVLGATPGAYELLEAIKRESEG